MLDSSLPRKCPIPGMVSDSRLHCTNRMVLHQTIASNNTRFAPCLSLKTQNQALSDCIRINTSINQFPLLHLGIWGSDFILQMWQTNLTYWQKHLNNQEESNSILIKPQSIIQCNWKALATTHTVCLQIYKILKAPIKMSHWRR